MRNETVHAWHEIITSRNASGLEDLLAEDVVFHSPVVHTPQRGKGITKLYLAAAFSVFGNETFRYTREVVSNTDAVLEFVTEIDGVEINGIDMFRWNEKGQITDFKVMIRPLKAINLIHQLMGEMLKKAKRD